MKLALSDMASVVGVKISEPRHLRVLPDVVEQKREKINPDTSTFDDFIGNTDAVIGLLALLEESEGAGDVTYPHLVLHGPYGVGKTKIALAIAKRRGTALHKVDDAKKLRKPKTLEDLMGKVTEGDVVFVDELHRLKGGEEALYSLMDTGEMTVSSGSGRDATVTTIRVPPFTLVAATTSLGSLSRPFRSRFIDVRLRSYTDDEISQILRQEARRQGVILTDDGADTLALLARGTARIAVVELITRAKSVARVISHKLGPDEEGEFPVPVIDTDAVETVMDAFGIDSLGLKEEDRDLLRALCIDMAGGPIGATKLGSAAGLDIETVRDLEQYLTKHHLMWFDGTGRKATVLAYKHLSEVDGVVYRPPARVVGWSRDRGYTDEVWLKSILR